MAVGDRAGLVAARAAVGRVAELCVLRQEQRRGFRHRRDRREGRAVERVFPRARSAQADHGDAADDGAAIGVGNRGLARAVVDERRDVHDFRGARVGGGDHRIRGSKRRRVVDGSDRQRGGVGGGAERRRAADRGSLRKIDVVAQQFRAGLVPGAVGDGGRFAIGAVGRVAHLQQRRIAQEQRRGGTDRPERLPARGGSDLVFPRAVAGNADDGHASLVGAGVGVGHRGRARRAVDEVLQGECQRGVFVGRADRGTARRRRQDRRVIDDHIGRVGVAAEGGGAADGRLVGEIGPALGRAGGRVPGAIDQRRRFAGEIRGRRGVAERGGLRQEQGVGVGNVVHRLVRAAVERIFPRAVARGVSDGDAAEHGRRIGVGDRGDDGAVVIECAEGEGNRLVVRRTADDRTRGRRREHGGVVDAGYRERRGVRGGTERGRTAHCGRLREVGGPASRPRRRVPGAEDERSGFAILRVRRVADLGGLGQEPRGGRADGPHRLEGRAVERIRPGSVARKLEDGDPAHDGAAVGIGDRGRARAVVDECRKGDVDRGILVRGSQGRRGRRNHGGGVRNRHRHGEARLRRCPPGPWLAPSRLARASGRLRGSRKSGPWSS